MSENGSESALVKTNTMPTIPSVKPQEIVDDAAEKAKVVSGIIEQGGLSKVFGPRGGKAHVFYEGWLTIGRFYECLPNITNVTPIMGGTKIVGYEAEAELIHIPTGQVMSKASAMCAKDENNWKNRDLYALRSMAETRAASKVLRLCFSWVMVLAGYKATPAEEMSDSFFGDSSQNDQTAKPPTPPESSTTSQAPSGGASPVPKAAKVVIPESLVADEAWWPEATNRAGGYRWAAVQAACVMHDIPQVDVETWVAANLRNAKGKPCTMGKFTSSSHEKDIISAISEGQVGEITTARLGDQKQESASVADDIPF